MTIEWRKELPVAAAKHAREAAQEAEYIRLRKKGVAPLAAGKMAGCTKYGQRRFELLLGYETYLYKQPDDTVPKFSRNDKYVSALLSAEPRGFGRIEGSRVVWGTVA